MIVSPSVNLRILVDARWGAWNWAGVEINDGDEEVSDSHWS